MTTDQTPAQLREAPSTADDQVAPASEAVEPAQPPAFPLARGRQKGYDRAAVDAFMARARAAFEADGDPTAAGAVDEPASAEPVSTEASADESATDEPSADEGSAHGEPSPDDQAPEVVSAAPAELPFSSATVRAAAFPLARKGYLIAAVDGALGRIEDAFAARERERRLAAAGAALWVAEARRTAQEILDRLSRPDKHKFGRTGVLRFGYRVDEVDLVARKLIRYFEEGEAISVEQVRQAAFRMQRAGYREEQVDALLDAVVEVMLAVR